MPHYRTERKWREWTDKHFVHLLSPNLYRTPSESLETFRWFSEVSEWDKLFPAWERTLMIYGGATAMYFTGQRMKKRLYLFDDVRSPLYRACRTWLAELKKRKTEFIGGKEPNLADLSFYGVLSSIEGCQAFDDICDNTKIGELINCLMALSMIFDDFHFNFTEPWFNAVRKYVSERQGTIISQVE